MRKCVISLLKAPVEVVEQGFVSIFHENNVDGGHDERQGDLDECGKPQEDGDAQERHDGAQVDVLRQGTGQVTGVWVQAGANLYPDASTTTELKQENNLVINQSVSLMSGNDTQDPFPKTVYYFLFPH